MESAHHRTVRILLRDSLLRRGLSGLLLLAQLLACSSWRTHSGAPQELWQDQQPKAVRVTRVDGSQLTLAAPSLQVDTLKGVVRGGRPGDSTPVAIPFAAIRELAVRRFDPGNTLALTAGIGLAMIVAIASIDCCGPDFRNTDSLKSSPLVYSWDGRTWRLDSGTFAGAITAGAARTDVDNLMYAVPQGRRLRLRVTNELQETDHLDAVSVMVVDHDTAVSVAPGSDGRLFSVGGLLPTLRSTDLAGRDASAAVGAPDGIGWESVVTGRDSASPADLRDGLELSFSRGGAASGRLVVDAQNTPWVPAMLTAFVAQHGSATQAWYDSLDANPDQVAQLAGMMAREGFLQVFLWSDGRWVPQGGLAAPGPELAKRQVLPLDLSIVQGDTVRVRLTSTPSFWWIDHAALDTSAARPMEVRVVRPAAARTNDGRDVLPLLASIDRRSYTMETGEGAELLFDLPPVRADRARSYLVRSTGWYRIRAPAEGAPDVALLDRLLREPGAAASFSVGRMNHVLEAVSSAR